MRFGGIIYCCYIIHKGARPPEKRYGVMGPYNAFKAFFRPALWRHGVLFSRKRYGVMGGLKNALWRYEGPLPPPKYMFSVEYTRIFTIHV